MTKTIATATLILAIGLNATSAMAQTGRTLTAGTNQSQVGLLLPAVQSVREAARRPASKSSDQGIISNGGGDSLEAELRKFFRNVLSME